MNPTLKQIKKMSKPKKQIKKKYRAKEFPLLAISFYKNRQGTLACQLTINTKTGKELHDETLNMRLFGRFVSESEFLDKQDRDSLYSFADAMRESIMSQNALDQAGSPRGGLLDMNRC